MDRFIDVGKGDGSNETEEIECLAACDTQVYDQLVTSSAYPNPETFKYTQEFCIVLKKLYESCKTRFKTMKDSFPNLCPTIQQLKVFSTTDVIQFAMLRHTKLYYFKDGGKTFEIACPALEWQKDLLFDSKAERKKFEEVNLNTDLVVKLPEVSGNRFLHYSTGSLAIC